MARKNKDTPRDPVIDRVIEKAGSVKELAQRLGCSPQAVWLWTEIPIQRAVAIEKITGIPKHEMRPDIWEMPRDRASA